MAEPQKEHPYHVRSTSLPSRSHPIAQQFDEELQKMKTWAAEASTSSSPATEILCSGIQGLAKLHSCVDNILKMPEAQRSVARCKHDRWVAEELDRSVRLLDMCGSTRDSLSLIKEQALELQSILRTRRTCDPIFQSKVQEYSSSMKKTDKEINKSLKELKQMDERCVDIYAQDDLPLVMRALREVREITITVYRSIFSSLMSETPRSKVSCGYWSLVSKAMPLKHKVTRDSSSSHILFALCKKISGQDIEVVEVQKQSKEMDCRVSAIEDGLQCLFQGLVRNRVALLNIVSL